jgi:hypothetical protein
MTSPYGDGPRPDEAYGGGPGGDPPAWSWPPPQVPPPAVPGRSNSTAAPVAIAAAVVLVIAVVVALIFYLHGNSTKGTAASNATSPTAPNAQSARDCTHSMSSGQVPTNGMVSAGGLSFPQSVAPNWRPKAEHRVPNSIDAISLDEIVSQADRSSWIGQVTVGITNFDQSMSLAAQAKLMLKCIAASELYEASEPKVPAVTPKAGHIDGLPTAEIDVAVTVTFADPTVKGDDLVIIVVGTSPSTYFLGASPIGDTARQGVVLAAVKALHVAAV